MLILPECKETDNNDYNFLECSMPNNYETTVGNLFAKFVDGSLKIKFDRDSFKIYFRESKLRNVNFLIKNAIIDFKGKYVLHIT